MATLHEKARVPVVDNRSKPTDVGGHDGRAARGRLERDQTERLGTRWHEADVSGLVVDGEARVPLGWHELHTPTEPELVHELMEPAHLGFAVVPARAAHHEQRHVRVELGEAAHREIGPLERLDTPHEQEHRR